MTNKPHVRPGHPRHGFQRRFIRSARKRRMIQIAMNRFENASRGEVRWAEGARPEPSR